MSFEIIDANTIFGPWPSERANMPVDRLAEAVTNHSLSRALAISTVGLLHNFCDGNAETLKSCEAHDNLTPVATIDPRGYFGPRGTCKKLADQRFKMFRFFPVTQQWDARQSVFMDICEELEEVTQPVMIQAKGQNKPTHIADVMGGKKIKTIMDGVTFDNMAEAVSVMRKYDNLLVTTRELRVPGALRFLVDQIGADRVIFASGCLRSSLASALDYIEDTEISDENKQKILASNIKTLLGG